MGRDFSGALFDCERIVPWVDEGEQAFVGMLFPELDGKRRCRKSGQRRTETESNRALEKAASACFVAFPLQNRNFKAN